MPTDNVGLWLPNQRVEAVSGKTIRVHATEGGFLNIWPYGNCMIRDMHIMGSSSDIPPSEVEEKIIAGLAAHPESLVDISHVYIYHNGRTPISAFSGPLKLFVYAGVHPPMEMDHDVRAANTMLQRAGLGNLFTNCYRVNFANQKRGESVNPNTTYDTLELNVRKTFLGF